MYICVLDFEATCWNDMSKKFHEIIEFPSVLYEIDEEKYDVNIIGEIQLFVKPKHDPILSDFCKNLTGIEQKQVDNGITLQKAINLHYEWIRNNTDSVENVIILTCGAWDLTKCLPDEIERNNIKTPQLYKKFINIKKEFEHCYNSKSKGMVNMLNLLGLKLSGRHHSGIDDCRNIGKILEKIVKDKHTDFTINFV